MAKPIVNIKFLADLAQFSTQMQNASRRLDKTGKKMQRIGTVLSAGLSTPLIGIGFAAVNTAAELEKLNTSLTTVFKGNEDAAKKAYDEINNFASKTPFQVDQVANAFIKLKNLGLDASISSLESYGNTTSALGKDLDQLIEAVADAATFEFERLKEFGIKTKQQGDKVSFTFQGVTTTVEKNATAIQNYLLDIGNTQFAGAIETQSNTFLGKLSTFRDNVKQLSADFGAIIIEGLKPFIEGIKNIVSGFRDLSPETKKFIVVIGGVAAAIGPLLALAGTILPAISTGFAVLTGPIGLVIAGLTAVGVVIYKNWKPIKKILVDIANYFVDLYNESIAFRFIVEGIKVSFQNIFRVGKFVFSSLGNLIKLVADNIKDSFVSIGDLIKAVLTGNFKAIPDILKKGFAEGLVNFKDFVQKSSEEFKKLKSDIQGNIQTGIENALRGKQYKLLGENVDTSEVEETLKNIATITKKSELAFFLKSENDQIRKAAEDRLKILKSFIGGSDKKEKQEKVGVAISAGFTDFDVEGIEDFAKTATEQIPNYADRLSEEEQRMMQNAQSFNEEFTQIWQNTASGFLENIGTMIAGLATGSAGIGDLAALMLSSLADMAIQLGRMAIQIGVAASAIGKALSNPLTAGPGSIIAGIALVALGTLVKSAASNIAKGGESIGGRIPALANGGIVMGPTLALVGEYAGAKSNPEVIAPLNKLQDLIRPQNNDTLKLTGNLKASGQDLLLVIDRAEKKRSRNT